MECSICWYPLITSKLNEGASNEAPEDVEVISLGCGHVYHRKCLNDWLESNQTCPSCREGINKTQIRKIFLESSGGPNEICNDCDALKEKVLDLSESNDIFKAKLASFEAMEEHAVNAQKKIEDLNVQVASLRMTMRSLESYNSSFAAIQGKYNKEIDSLRKSNAKLQKQNEELVASQLSDQEKLQSLTDQIRDLRTKNEDLQNQKESCLSDQKADKTMIQDMINENVFLKQNGAAMLLRMGSAVKAVKTEIGDLTEEVANLRESNEALLARIATLMESPILANEETEHLKEKIEILEGENDSLLENLRWSMEKNQDLMAVVGSLRKTEKIEKEAEDLMSSSNNLETEDASFFKSLRRIIPDSLSRLPISWNVLRRLKSGNT